MIKLNREAVVKNFLHEEKKDDKDINIKLIKDGALEPLEHEHVENNPESVEKHIEAADKHADKEKEKSKEVAKKIAVKQEAVLFSESLKFKDRASLTEFLLKLREQKIRRRVVPLHEDAEGYKFEVRYEKPLKEGDKSAPKSIEDCQKWIDYDMKHYGKISDNTNDIIKKAGYQIIKDDHGDYEVTAGKYENLNEEIEIKDLEDLAKLKVGDNLKVTDDNLEIFKKSLEMKKKYDESCKVKEELSDNFKSYLLDQMIDNMCEVEGVRETIKYLAGFGLNKKDLLELKFEEDDIDIVLDEPVDDDVDIKIETESVESKTINEAWDFSDEDNKASEIFAKDLEEDFSFLNTEDKQVLKEEVEKKVETTEETSMWDFGDDE